MKKYIRVEFRTTFGFVGDGTFALDKAIRVIQIRSASKRRYPDFGPNYS
ncbi:MAG: DUF1499 domain-containing protein [Deltaproteobacteria bacterium]